MPAASKNREHLPSLSALTSAPPGQVVVRSDGLVRPPDPTGPPDETARWWTERLIANRKLPYLMAVLSNLVQALVRHQVPARDAAERKELQRTLLSKAMATLHNPSATLVVDSDREHDGSVVKAIAGAKGVVRTIGATSAHCLHAQAGLDRLVRKISARTQGTQGPSTGDEDLDRAPVVSFWDRDVYTLLFGKAGAGEFAEVAMVSTVYAIVWTLIFLIGGLAADQFMRDVEKATGSRLIGLMWFLA